MKQNHESRIGHSKPLRDVYQGPQAWLIPSMEESFHPGLPAGMSLTDLTDTEIKAAIRLRIIHPSFIDQEVAKVVSEVTDAQAAQSALSMLQKLEAYCSEQN